MMECWLETWDGKRLVLPRTLEWTFRYGMGTPCDSFSVSCIWNEAAAAVLADAVRFAAQEGGQRRFTGVVDEAETVWDGNGARLTIHGRGMAALLLDNEAEGTEYQTATVGELLRDHAEPYGIQTVGGAGLAPVTGFSVSSGESEWAVLYRFARYCHGVEPWCDEWGRLRLDGWQDGTRHIVDGKSPVLSAGLSQKRYGVLSQVVVRDRAGTERHVVSNGAFLQRGGQRRKVMVLPQKTGYEAMRYSGAYQIARSSEEETVLSLRLAQTWAARVGDWVEIRLERPRLRGSWRVRSCETGVGRGGAYTALELTERGG